MTLQEINAAIKQWQQETGGTFIFLANEKGKNPLCHYAGKGSALGALIGSAMASGTDFCNFVKLASLAVAACKAKKKQCTAAS